MSKIAYAWRKDAPPAPDVYVTRRNEVNYLTERYWDGETWFEIAYTGSRGGTPFEWPKPSRTKLAPMAGFYKDNLHLRKISAHLQEIQWGEPYKVFDEKEVLKHLVATGKLPANWRECYQEEMRTGKAAGRTRIELLEDLADEYDRLVRHMDAGGDFTAFQVAEARRRNGESAEQETFIGEKSCATLAAGSAR